MLSLEVSLDGKRLLTNGGTSSYDIGPVRAGERATAAHATLEIDGHNSSEVWSSFRVGRRAHPFDVAVAEEGGTLSAVASHDGYRWLPGQGRFTGGESRCRRRRLLSMTASPAAETMT